MVPPDGTPSQMWAAGDLCYVTAQISFLCAPESREREAENPHDRHGFGAHG